MAQQPDNDIARFEAEESLLGAILIQSCANDRSVINQVSQIVEIIDFEGCFLKVNPFNWPVHARVFYAMLKCDNPPHEINTASSMNTLGILKIHDCVHLAHYVSICPCSLDYLDYAKAVRQYSIKKQVKYYADKGDFIKLNQLTRSPKYTGGVDGL